MPAGYRTAAVRLLPDPVRNRLAARPVKIPDTPAPDPPGPISGG